MNGDFRALLIGVPAYKDPAIKDLPFITDDLAELANGLRGAGYSVDTHDPAETDRDSIDTAVEGFFQDARPGQTLLLYLSGHGVHNQNVDYLVPKGAMTRSRDFPGRCVSLDFGTYLERSRAGNVIILVDACREGITLREMGGINVANWSQMQVQQVAGRRVAYIYACSPGERARYATTANESFSLFSRALAGLVADPQGPRTLSELWPPLQDRLDTLTADHASPRQLVRVNGVSGTGVEPESFIVFERPDRVNPQSPKEHLWALTTREHPVWSQLGAAPGTEALREATAALVDRVAWVTAKDDQTAVDDPWRSTGFTERMAERVQWLLSTVINPEKLALTSAEAALLVSFPYLHSAYWTRVRARAAHIDPVDLTVHESASDERRSYEQFVAGYPRLVRRAERSAACGDHAAAQEIGWWLFHRWLVRQPSHYRTDVMSELIALRGTGPGRSRSSLPLSPPEARLVSDVFVADHLMSLTRALRMTLDPHSSLPPRQVAGSTALEQHIREQLILDLVMVAYRFALDPTSMPQVVADHLGISFSVDLSDMHATLDAARWNPRGRTRVLEAVCSHPAVGLALTEQAASLDALLGAIDARAGHAHDVNTSLEDLPVHATADQVRAATTHSGRPVYEPGELRFRLADDRIQEILMGKQLYGDPSLAVRELYQNALDACRYRKARTEYLRAIGSPAPHWTGKISFHQGLDEQGRAYLECRDNGVGMGERELREVFSHAGMRFADLPDYLEERATWESEGVHMYPNSRFGVGVLSYFMLADDITVSTCRLDRDGYPGERLEVNIAGPGSLFRIQNRGRSHDAGTTVRLHLRAPDDVASCTDVLRRILWISEFAVTSTADDSPSITWDPGQLSPYAPLGGDDPYSDNSVRNAHCEVVATASPKVWWCSANGGILADGLWMDVPMYGAVVNLTGAHTPVLTVDRRRPIAYDEVEVDRLLREEIPVLLERGAPILRHSWLSRFSRSCSKLAEAILDQAAEARYQPWVVAGCETDVISVGCFSVDGQLFRESGGIDSMNHVSPEIYNWRLRAWVRAGNFPGLSISDSLQVPQGRPLDSRILSRDLDGSSPWLEVGDRVPLGHIVKAASDTGRSPVEVADRLEQLGYQVVASPLPETIDHDDTRILSRDLDGSSPWLGVSDRVPLGHIVSAASHTGRSPAEIADRLEQLGYQVEASTLPETIDHDDSRILSRNLNASSPWLEIMDRVPLGHIVSAASRTGRSPVEVADRLEQLGYQVEASTLPETIDHVDSRILSRNLNASSPWLGVGDRVPLGHIVIAASDTGRSPVEVADRLEQLGYQVVASTLPETIDHDDSRILSRKLNASSPWLGVGDRVPLGHIVSAASRTGRSPVEIADRLEQLGYQVVASPLPETIDHDDTRILSSDLDGSSPWLGVSDRVPLGHIVSAASHTGRSPAEIADRLEQLGYQVEASTLPETIDHDDTRILSRNLNASSPWLEIMDRVPLGHIVSAASRTGRSPVEVADRLEQLGYQAETSPLPETIDHDDSGILSRDLNTTYPWEDRRRQLRWLRIGHPVPLVHIVTAASRTGRSPAEVARRLQQLGFELSSELLITGG